MDISHSKKRHCCAVERRRLIKELRKCDYCSTSYEEYQECYSDTAAESGDKARGCIDPAV